MVGQKPKVVFDVKMPRYEYRQHDGNSMSVDRTKSDRQPLPDCLANLMTG
jgi:hypothetical protein